MEVSYPIGVSLDSPVRASCLFCVLGHNDTVFGKRLARNELSSFQGFYFLGHWEHWP